MILHTALLISNILEIVKLLMVAGGFFVCRFSRKGYRLTVFMLLCGCKTLVDIKTEYNMLPYILYCLIALVILLDNTILEKVLSLILGVLIIGILDGVINFCVLYLGVNAICAKVVTSVISIVTIWGYGKWIGNYWKKKIHITIADGILLCVITLTNGLIMSMLEEHMTTKYGNHIPWITLLLLIIFAVGYLIEITVLFALRELLKEQQHKLQAEELLIEAQRTYYNELENRDMETRRFRHDIKDHLLMIQNYMHSHDVEKAIDYSEVCLEQIQDKKILSVGNTVIDALLNHYYLKLSEMGIELMLKGSFPETSSIDAYDLCSLFSNLIRNAMEACERYGGKIISLSLLHDKDYIFISERNACEKTENEISEIPKSNKADQSNHGFGKANMERVIEKYEGNYTVNVEDGFFEINIALRNQVEN